MGKREIIEELARGRVVEGMARSITHRPVEGDIRDLCQTIYLYLLEYDEDKLVDLHSHGQLGFFIVRVLMNQYRSGNSRYHRDCRLFGRMSVPIETIANKADDNG